MHGDLLSSVRDLRDGLTVVRDDDDEDPERRYKLIANMQDHCMWAPAYPDHYPDIGDFTTGHFLGGPF